MATRFGPSSVYHPTVSAKVRERLDHPDFVPLPDLAISAFNTPSDWMPNGDLLDPTKPESILGLVSVP